MADDIGLEEIIDVPLEVLEAEAREEIEAERLMSLVCGGQLPPGEGLPWWLNEPVGDPELGATPERHDQADGETSP